ncbi:hypothetical protein [Serratia fonticola]|uniref:hypothetical protein n=1 Tax=Serratia fonticola TaxID=47917 RepID=UPI00301C0BE9
MELFHGSRARFTEFDTSFKGTGEAGTIDAIWFTNNYAGARNHARYKCRNEGSPLVYRCTLSERALLADFSKPLSEQPRVAELLHRNLPVGISTSLSLGRKWYGLAQPHYQNFKGKMLYTGNRGVNSEESIELFISCGLHGVYDWEGAWTDSYLHGPSIIIFDLSVLDDLTCSDA